MKLFIANTTKQVQDFYYRIPGHPSSSGMMPLLQKIAMGGQICIPADLNTPEIDGIIEQHQGYGLISADKVDAAKGYVGLMYSIDKPVPAAKMAKLIGHNTDVMVERGQKNRESAGIAALDQANQFLAEQRPGDAIDAFEMSVVEETRDPKDQSKEVAEGVRVVHDRADVTRGRPAPGKRGRMQGTRRRA